MLLLSCLGVLTITAGCRLHKKKPSLEGDGFKCPYSCPYMGRLRCLVVPLDFLPVERDPGRDAANGKDGCDNDQSDRPTGESVFGIFNIENLITKNTYPFRIFKFAVLRIMFTLSILVIYFIKHDMIDFAAVIAIIDIVSLSLTS